MRCRSQPSSQPVQLWQQLDASAFAIPPLFDGARHITQYLLIDQSRDTGKAVQTELKIITPHGWIGVNAIQPGSLKGRSPVAPEVLLEFGKHTLPFQLIYCI